MLMVMFLCLAILLHPAFGEECCKTKSVGSVQYVLADIQEDTSPYGCEDNCVYHMVADGSSSKDYCFKSGRLPVHCHGETGGSTNAAAGVCALNTDCDKCGNNVNTINGVRYCCASDCNSPTTIINGECTCGVGGHGGAAGGDGSSTKGMGGHGAATGGMGGHGAATGGMGGHGAATGGMGGHGAATEGMGGHGAATGGMGGHGAATGGMGGHGAATGGMGGHGAAGGMGGHGAVTEGMGGHGAATGGMGGHGAAGDMGGHGVAAPVERICKQDTDCQGCKSGQDLNGVRYCCADDCNSTDFSFSFTQDGVATCKCGTN